MAPSAEPARGEPIAARAAEDGRGLRPRASALARAAGLGALVLLAVGLRAEHLGWPPLWADEAESATNALTIVATGLPRADYMGLPLYENVLLRPWPGNPEYAYRDLSYSDRGLAVYHGWLPLYATAAAFRLAGVTPEAARRGPPVRDGTTAELVRWTVVPRLPALAFSALLVLLAFALGWRTGGDGAGWAMALATAAGGIFVWFGRQARYYSPALAAAAFCGLSIWTACRRGRLRDHLLAGLSLAVAFHTHVLTAVAAGALYVLAAACLAVDRRAALRGVASAGALAALLVLPWAWWSGFFEMRERVPPARGLLHVSAFLASLPSTDPVVLLALAVPVAGALVLLLAARRRSLPARLQPLSSRVRAALRQFGPPVAFAAGWLLLSWASFVLFVPAPSYFVLRLKLMVALPGLLLLVLALAAVARVLRPAQERWLTPLGVLVLLVLARQVPPPLVEPEAHRDEHELVRLVRSWQLSPGARVYAMPANQLPLTYYTGLPVQSVAAVRKSWLDGFEGDLVIVDGRWYEPLQGGEVQRMAAAHGVDARPAEAEALARRAVQLATVEDLTGRGFHVQPAQEPAPGLERELVLATRRNTREFLAGVVRGTPLAGAARFAHWGEFWPFFFYWFADPLARSGERVNFRERALRGRVHVLDSGFVVYDCRPRAWPPLVD